MSELTDPARELADLCEKLRPGSPSDAGAKRLAAAFEVPQWSSAFYQIIFSISTRIDVLIEIVNDLKMDKDFKNEAKEHLEAIRRTFTQDGLNNQWKISAENFLAPANVQPIKMLSPFVRQTVAYPKLSDVEATQVLSEVAQLAAWLKEQQLAENDFIRQAILDGITQFEFRLKRLQWLGWGYTLESLRQVISAYIMLEQSGINAAEAPDAAAVLKKTGLALKKIFEAAKFTKDALEVSGFALKMYGAVCAAIQTGHVAGLLLPG